MTNLSAEELLNWNDTNATHWRKLFDKYPEALALPCDIREGATVADLLQHIVAAELRFAERLLDEPISSYDAIPKSSVAELFATHDLALSKFRTVIADSAYPWDQEFFLATRSAGDLITIRRGVLFHALLHSMRHYAQLATLLRHASITPNWEMDYLYMTARRA